MAEDFEYLYRTGGDHGLKEMSGSSMMGGLGMMPSLDHAQASRFGSAFPQTSGHSQGGAFGLPGAHHGVGVGGSRPSPVASGAPTNALPGLGASRFGVGGSLTNAFAAHALHNMNPATINHRANAANMASLAAALNSASMSNAGATGRTITNQQVQPRQGVPPVGLGPINGSRTIGGNVNMAALNGRSMAAAMNAAQGPVSANVGVNVGSGRTIGLGVGALGNAATSGLGMMPSGANMVLPPSSNAPNYNPSGDILAMINKAFNTGQEQGEPLPYDMSEFPALSGSRMSSVAGGSSGSDSHNLNANRIPYSSAAGSEPLPAPSFASVGSMAGSYPQLKNTTEFTIQSEDFPALPGFKGRPLSSSSAVQNLDMHSDVSQQQKESQESLLSSLQAQQHFQAQMNSGYAGIKANTTFPHSQFLGRQLNDSSLLLASQQQSQAPSMQQRAGGLGVFDQQQSSQPSQHVGSSQGQSLGHKSPPPGATGQSQKAAAALIASNQFGLLGLLSVIRMTDQDLNTLALGMDLTTLGLNLNSPESLYATFGSPWADGPSRREPEYCLPTCYYMLPPALKTTHFSKFTLETLFYIFYNLPRDMLQACAAAELYNRDWRFHKDLKTWFTRPLPTDMAGLMKNSPWVFFDIQTWERRALHDVPKNFAEGLLQEAPKMDAVKS